MSYAIVVASGTITPTVGVEATLVARTASGEYFLEIDTSNMAAGDILEVRIKCPVLAGGAVIVKQWVTFANAPSTDDIGKVLRYVSDLGATFTITQTFGTQRAFPWKVLQLSENVTQWFGQQVPRPSTAGIPTVDVYSLQGTPVSTSGVFVSGCTPGQDVLLEAYTKGAFTLPQAMYEIAQVVGQFSISSTTLTAQKRDASTTAATFTLNDPANPTARTRTT